jgi:hypothetical protein
MLLSEVPSPGWATIVSIDSVSQITPAQPKMIEDWLVGRFPSAISQRATIIFGALWQPLEVLLS